MFLLSYNRSIVSTDADGNLLQIPLSEQNNRSFKKISIDDARITCFEMHKAGVKGVSFRKDGYYLCAEPQRRELVINRTEVGPWEIFTPISEEDLRKLDYVRSNSEEKSRFASRVEQMNKCGEPVKIYCGAGPVPRAGFLNLDILMQAPEFYASNRDDYFIFPFADEGWEIPNNSVDYVFHEDFIEHIDQTSQYQILAEALRVLRPNCWHRVNTPNINWTMKERSDFHKGFHGVYTGERAWGHIAIYSPRSLEEAAILVGYKKVIFTARHQGNSVYCVRDNRPADDRDDIIGNIYADLQK